MADLPPGDEHRDYAVQRTVSGGIERITYTPNDRQFETPILMLHGMWHGAWCWEPWQAQLADWGWQSQAVSLPGHAGSAAQRPLRLCTLGYYLRFVRAAIEQLPRAPVLMGHSMGGALVQRYLKKVSDNMPAAVLVSSWTAQGTFRDGLLPLLRLGPGSVLVLSQHNPPLWFPPRYIATPMLWLAGEADAVVTEAGQQRSAAHYGADYVAVPNAGHNLMMERDQSETVGTIHRWLCDNQIG